MRRVTMTLHCPPVGERGGVLHFRPAWLLQQVRQLFTATDVRIHRNEGNCTADFLKRCPTAVLDPEDYCLLVLAGLCHGEQVVLEVDGRDEELAATLVKTAFEHMDLDREDLLSQLLQAGENVQDADRDEILGEARARLSRPHEAEPAVAYLGRRLHSLTVSILPELARYLHCSVLLLYRTSSDVIQQRVISADDQGVVLELLKDAPDKGTPITIHVSGQNQEEARRAFRGVLENLDGIETWIRKRGLNIRDPVLVQEVLKIASAGTSRRVVKKNTVPMSPFRIHKLLETDSVVLSADACSKGQAIQQLATVHAAHVQIPGDRIEDCVWDREEQCTTLYPGGLAVPHAHLDGPPGIRLAMGVYKGGVDWSEADRFRRAGDNTAYVVLMFVTRPDAQQEYLGYLAQVACLFENTPELVEQLRGAQSIPQALAIVQNSETLLFGA